MVVGWSGEWGGKVSSGFCNSQNYTNHLAMLYFLIPIIPHIAQIVIF